jgi:hypothetical protein
MPQRTNARNKKVLINLLDVTHIFKKNKSWHVTRQLLLNSDDKTYCLFNTLMLV